MILDDLADVRTGDKGSTLIVAVFPRDAAAFDTILERLTRDRLRAHFGDLVTGPVERTVAQGVGALVFDVPGVLGGGVTESLCLDGHGKTLSYHVLGLELGA